MAFIPSPRVLVDWENVGVYGAPGHANGRLWVWMDEASGSLIDFSGQGNDLGAVGSPTYRELGPKARYLAVGVATGNHFEIADNADLSITGALTLVFWAKFDALAAAEVVASKWLNTGSQKSYRLYKNSNDVIVAQISPDGADQLAGLVTTNGTVTAAQFHFCALRFNPSTELAVWLDAEKNTDTTGIPASIFDSTAKFMLGRGDSEVFQMTGDIGPGGAFAGLLTDAEIDQIRIRGPYADITEYVDWRDAQLAQDRGRDTALDAFKTGEARHVLLNKDKRFTPEDTTGPLFGKLLPNLRYQFKAVSLQVPYFVFSGFTKSIDPVAAEKGGPPVQALMELQDPMALFQKQTVRTLLITNTLTGQVINDILDEADWPTADRLVDAGQMTIVNMAWDDIEVASALLEIVRAEGGQLYIGKDGKVVFEDRHHKAKPPHNSPLATIQDRMEKAEYRMADELVRNRIDAFVYPRKVGTADAEIARLETTPLIAPGQTVEFFLQYKDPDTQLPSEAQNVTTPVEDTDWDANTKSDGTGIDISADLTLTFTNKGRSGFFSFVHGGALPGVITLAKVRGQALTSFDALLVRAEDAASIGPGKPLLLHTMDSRLRQKYEETRDEVDFFLSHLKPPAKGVFDVTMSNGTAQNLLDLLQYEISDRLRFINDPNEFDLEGYIGGITLHISDNGKRWRAVWKVETFGIDGQAFILDTSQLDSADVLWY